MKKRIKLNYRQAALFLFLFLNFIHLNAAYLTGHLGLVPEFLNFHLTNISLLFIPVLLFFYNRKIKATLLTKRFKEVLFAFTIYSVFLAILGVLKLNPKNFYLFDISSYFVFISFIFIGTNRLFWEDLLKVGLPILLLSLIVNIQATLILDWTYQTKERNLLDYKGSVRLARIILSYETQWSLALWPIFLLTAYRRSNKIFVIILSVVVFVLLQQVLFQKRGPSVRVLIFILAFAYVIPRMVSIKGLRKVVAQKRKILIAGVLFFIIAGVLYLPTELISNQFLALLDRLNGETGHIGRNYTNGFWGIFTTENERVLEVIQMIEDFNVFEMVFGKGYGGYFKEYMFFLTDKSTLHIGVTNIFLKGGILLSVLYFSMVAYGLFCYQYQKKDIVGAACYAYLFLATLFQFAEGWFYYSSNAFECMLYPATIGYLVSNKMRHNRKKRNLPQPIPVINLGYGVS